jgi:hypothetical protein
LFEPANPNALEDVRGQVKRMLTEPITREVCLAARDPKSRTWTSNGMPHVAESLAALYDWRISHSPR